MTTFDNYDIYDKSLLWWLERTNREIKNLPDLVSQALVPVSKLKSKKKKKRTKVRDHAILGFVGKITFNSRRPIRTLIISLLSLYSRSHLFLFPSLLSLLPRHHLLIKLLEMWCHRSKMPCYFFPFISMDDCLTFRPQAFRPQLFHSNIFEARVVQRYTHSRYTHRNDDNINSWGFHIDPLSRSPNFWIGTVEHIYIKKRRSHQFISLLAWPFTIL